MEKYIEEAKNKFEEILKGQVERANKIKNNNIKEKKNKEKIVVGIIPGDGIGPYIVNCAKKVANYILSDEIENGSVELRDIEGLTIENRIEKNQAVPDDVLCEIKKCDVLLKGPTTTPNGGSMESANVTLRRELDLFANVRPVAIKEEGIDWTFFRENTEGEYVLGSKGVEIPGVLACDFKVTTIEGTKRIAKKAFEFAKNNNKKSVSIVTKANIMKKTDGLFSKICREVAEEYPNIMVDEWYIDIMTANLVNKSIRSNFEVFVLPNLYGDIITDEAAQIQGGVGTAGSANIGDEYAMFEAIHGTAPRLVEIGLGEYANPESILRALAMLLSHIGKYEKSQRLSKALDEIAKLPGYEMIPEEKKVNCDMFAQKLISLL